MTRVLAAAVTFASLGVAASMTTASATVRPASVTYLKLAMAKAYTPTAPNGGTDDYHCSLINPHVTKNSYIVSSKFVPGDNGATEVHHAILFMIPPNWAATAQKLNKNGKGWTCFGESVIPGAGLHFPGTSQPSGSPTWLTGWAPGHGSAAMPAGTGVLFPKNSLVVMQIHYNMLVSKKAIKSTLTLGTMPTTANLKPLSLDPFLAPPDVPCLSSWNPSTIPLCTRSNSLAYLGQRFGKSAVNFVNTLEAACGRNVSDPNPSGSDTTSCMWRNFQNAHIVAITAHMHLTGQSMKVVLDPGTAKQVVLLNVTNFNFDYQRSYPVPNVPIVNGDKIQISCTYNPIVHNVNPQLRNAPKRYVTWGDGSSDEMCLSLVATV